MGAQGRGKAGKAMGGEEDLDALLADIEAAAPARRKKSKKARVASCPILPDVAQLFESCGHLSASLSGPRALRQRWLRRQRRLRRQQRVPRLLQRR